LRGLTAAKIAELVSTITLKQAGKSDQALAIVRTDRGKILMDQIRALVDQIENTDRTQLSTRITTIGSVILLILIAAAAALVSRDYRERQLQTWLRNGQMGLSECIAQLHRI
jgi:CHASE3 domain sensor protein